MADFFLIGVKPAPNNAIKITIEDSVIKAPITIRQRTQILDEKIKAFQLAVKNFFFPADMLLEEDSPIPKPNMGVKSFSIKQEEACPAYITFVLVHTSICRNFNFGGIGGEIKTIPICLRAVEFDGMGMADANWRELFSKLQELNKYVEEDYIKIIEGSPELQLSMDF